jgi:transcriptional regulator with XRE-family HTH domain
MQPDPKRLRAAREAANLTQAAAAADLSCSLRTVGRWEAGTTQPSDRDLRAIAVVYGCHTSDLCEASNANP